MLLENRFSWKDKLAKMVSELEKEMIQTVGWTIVCENPMEMEHEDGSSVNGNSACKSVIKDAIAEYHYVKQEEVLEAEKARKANTTKDLDLTIINGNEIIDFLNKERDKEEELCDCSVSGFKFDSQEIKDRAYVLLFTGTYNNWGEDQFFEGQEIIIDKHGVHVRLDDPFYGDGSDNDIEDVLTSWLETHTFSNDLEEKFDRLIQDVYDTLPQVSFVSREEIKGIINKLEEAYTYMK